MAVRIPTSASVAPLFEYEDRAAINPDYICALCASPFVDPMSDAAEHIYCALCWRSALEKSSKCPECHAPVLFSELKPNAIPSRLLNALRVRCSNRPHGCKWVGPRIDVVAHGRSCASQPCPNKPRGCLWAGPLSAISVHTDTACEHVDVPCPTGCGHVGPRGNQKAHLGTCHVMRERLVHEVHEAEA